MTQRSPKQEKYLHNILKILMLCFFCTICSSCGRLLIGALDHKPLLTIQRPYFSITREEIHEIATKHNSMTPFLILDLPFEFVVDALLEAPWKALNDALMPLHERAKEKESSYHHLYGSNLETIFEQGLQQKGLHLLSDDYLRVFKIKLSQGVFMIDVDRLLASGQGNQKYLARYLDAIVKQHKAYGLLFLNKYEYLRHPMLPIYRYLLSHSLKPSDYNEECAIWYAVVNYLHSEKQNPQQLELIKLLLKKGCNPNAILARSPFTSAVGGNSVNDMDASINDSLIRSFSALDLACEYLEQSKGTSPPDEKAIESATTLIQILRDYGAKHTEAWHCSNPSPNGPARRTILRF